VLLQSAPMARALQTGTSTGTPTDQAWRVIALLNVFRLIVPMVLLLVFFFDAPTRSVGSHLPGLFLGVTIAYFAFAMVSIQTIQWRSPSVQWQAMIQLGADAIAMALLIHASGGITSGLATLLVLPAGATATIVERRYALLGTSIITLALLAETTFSAFQGESTGPDFLVTGLTGASLFAITLLAIPYARRLRESEALVKQREIDIANLNELNEFIVQHLRESILVVDELDRIRLINETAARLLQGGPVPSGYVRWSMSPLACCSCWKAGAGRLRTDATRLASSSAAAAAPSSDRISSRSPRAARGPCWFFSKTPASLRTARSNRSSPRSVG
jgi:two-component system, NtrC family, sensor histidine kinase PilS